MRTLDFRLGIETKDAEKKVDKFNQELEETNKLTELELVLKNADAVTSVKELNEAMEQLQDQALKFGEGSDEFVKAATKAGELKKRMDDVNRSIDTVASGGQLGQLTTSFEGLRQSALSFDIEGINRNFALMRTQIAGAGTAALGLGQGLNVAAIAARGLAVALAATGITIIIAAVAVLVSEFENLADAGGLIGTIFTAIGDTVEVVREKILELLDSLGLIDLAAKQAAESQAQYFDDLAADLEANGDLYDEYTKQRLQLEIDFYKKTEEIRKNDELSEAQKQDRIKALTERRIRDVKRLEDNASRERNEEQARRDKSFLEIQLEINERLLNNRLIVVDSNIEKELKLIEQRFSKERQLEIEKLNKSQITQEQYNKWLLDRQKEILKEQGDIYQERLDIEKQTYNQSKFLITENARIQRNIIEGNYGMQLVALKNRLYDEEQALKRNHDVQRELLKNQVRDNRITYEEYSEQAIALQKRLQDELNRSRENDAQYLQSQEKLLNTQKLSELREVNDLEKVELNKLAVEKLDLQIQLQENLTKIAETEIKAREFFEQQSFNNLQNQLDNQSKLFEAAYLQERARIYQDYADGLISSEEDLGNKLTILDAEYLQKRLDKQRSHTDTLRTFWETAADLGIVSRKKVDDAVRESLNTELELETELAQKKKQIDDDVVQHKLSNIEKFNQRFIEAQDKINAITAMVGQTAAQIGDIMTRVSNRRLQELEEQNVAELAAVQSRLDAGLITEEEAYNQSLAINEQYNRAKYEQEKKAFEQQKAIQIVNAVIQGIQSVQAAFSSGMAYPFIGPATGAVFAGIAAAFSAAQVALIASEKFPSYGAYSGGAGTQLGSISTPSTSGAGGVGGAGSTAPQVPASFFTNSGAIVGGEAMINPGGIYEPAGSNSTQVWVLESDITGSQNQVQVTEDRSYFDAGAYGG